MLGEVIIQLFGILDCYLEEDFMETIDLQSSAAADFQWLGGRVVILIDVQVPPDDKTLLSPRQHSKICACLGDLNLSLGKELVDVFAGGIALLFSTRNLINEALLREERNDGGALFLGALLPVYDHNKAVSVWTCGCLETILVKGGFCII